MRATTTRRTTPPPVRANPAEFARLRGDMTQQQLADALARTQAWVSVAEAGKPVSRASLLHAALYWGVKPDAIIACPEPAPPLRLAG